MAPLKQSMDEVLKHFYSPCLLFSRFLHYTTDMNIYFSGIGGVGIGPLAQIAFDAGYQVQGSDANDSLMTRNLQGRGISVNIGQDGAFLEASHTAMPIDWFVYTAALPHDHPELVKAHELGIKTAKRDELLAHIIAEKNLKLIAVAGTHGKTTTTGMLVWTLQQLGIPVSYSVGTTLSFGPSGKFDPASEYFVYECDEFDRNFLHFHPYLSLITSIDYDHPDTYPTRDDYLNAFRQFAEQSEHVITWSDEHEEMFRDMENTDFLIPESETFLKSLVLEGEKNRRNAALAWCGLLYLDIHSNVVGVYLERFPGTDRRFEKLADDLYTDYGHHPVEIAATLQMARELSDHVVLVYQPHQNIRQHELKDQYTNQFELAEEVYWLPTYLSREDPNLAILTPEELTQNITNKNVVQVAELNDELWDIIQEARNEGKLVLCMGAGSIDGWVRSQLTK
jgi:UDP-N-acetylmuramate--alanine ligase